MSLDKQRILSELGSVINQLQSADCGCMGKLFGNQGGDGMGMGSSMHQGNHGHGSCCQHGNFQGGNGMAGNMNNRMCMGSCNPPKLYADTYNYLNHNLMQPTMNEVYSDLKSISPENTIMNNPLGAKMGLSTQGGGMPQDNTVGMNQGNMGGMVQGNMGGMVHGNMGGMVQGNMAQGNMGVNAQDGIVAPDNMGNIAQHNMGMGRMGYMGNMHQGNMGGSHMAYNVSANQDSSGMTSSPMQNAQQMSHFNGMGPKILDMMMSSSKKSPGSRPSYQMGDNGAVNQQLVQGQDMGANLQGSQQSPNAIQNQPQTYMVPNGQQNFAQNQGSAMNAMNPNQMQQNPMNLIGNKTESNSSNVYGMHSMGMSKFNEMFPGVKGVNGNLEFDPMAIAIQMNPANQKQSAMKQMQNALMGNKGTQNIYKNMNENTSQSAKEVPAAQQSIPQTGQENSASAPSATTDNIQQNMQASENVNQPPQQVQQINPNLANPVVGQHMAETANPVSQIQANQDPKSQTLKKYEFNTLGQPVDMLPVESYRMNYMQNLPQGYPATINPRASNVRSSPSKTSLLGKVGRTQSRIQMQKIYNQYKSAQSNSLQNIAEIRQPFANQVAPPIERIGGDAQLANQDYIENRQDVDKGGDAENIPQKHTENFHDGMQSFKGRNGLQDMVYTAYPLTSAWTFHGDRGSPRFPQNSVMRV